MTDYLKKYGVPGYRKFQEGGAAEAPAPAPGGGVPAGPDPAVQQAAEVVMQVVDAALQGDPQAGEIVMQIAQALAGGAGAGAPEGAPAAMHGAEMYRRGGVIGGPTFKKRSVLIAHQQ